jgi:hypothetical protein
MGGRPVDIRDRVDVRNGKQQVVGYESSIVVLFYLLLFTHLRYVFLCLFCVFLI